MEGLFLETLTDASGGGHTYRGALEGDGEGTLGTVPLQTQKDTGRGHTPSERPAILEAGFRQEPRQWSDEEVKGKGIDGTRGGDPLHKQQGFLWVLTS